MFERGVSFADGAGKLSTGRINLYKRGYLVLETKQDTNTPDQAAKVAPRQAEGKPQGLCRARYRQMEPDDGPGSFH